jgi:hypothetical protein
MATGKNKQNGRFMAANSENEWNVGSSNYTSNTKLSGENQFQEKESWVGSSKL